DTRDPRHRADHGRGHSADLSRPFPPWRLVRAPAHADDPGGLATVAGARAWRSSGRVGFSSMKSFLRGLFGLIAALALGGTAMAADLEDTLYFDVPAGRVVIEMRPDLAPAPVAQP